MVSHIYAKNILNALFKTSGSAGVTPEQELSSFGLTTFTFETNDPDSGEFITKTVQGVTAQEQFDAFETDGYAYKNATLALNRKRSTVNSSQWYKAIPTGVSESFTYPKLDKDGRPIINPTTNKPETLSVSFTAWYARKEEQQTVPYPSHAFLALFTVMPDSDGNNYEEPGSESTYIRVDLDEDIIAGQKVLSPSKEQNGLSVIENNKIIMYPEIDTIEWGTIKGFGVFETQETGSGKPVIWGPLKNEEGNITEVTTQPNYVPLFRVGQFKITLG